MALKRVQTPDLDAPHIRDDRFTAFSNYFCGSRRAGTSFIKPILRPLIQKKNVSIHKSVVDSGG